MSEENTPVENTAPVETQGESQTQLPQGDTTKGLEVSQENQGMNEDINMDDFNLAEIVHSFIDSGELTEEQIKLLDASKIPTNAFEMIVESQRQIIDKNTNEVLEVVGGREVYTEMQKFAQESLSPESIEIYHQALHSGNLEIAKLAVAGLHALYQKSQGGPKLNKPSTRVGGKSSTSPMVGDVYQSQQDVLNAMGDPRYGRDATYTRGVDEKRARSQY